ncbi:MAG: sensor histidine kinase [Planctomycetota bacterium]|jgi:signal transduction histidine kinase
MSRAGWLLAALPLVALLAWAAAGSQADDAQASIDRSRALLEERFAGWRARVLGAAQRMKALAPERDPRVLFEEAADVVAEEKVHGVAILDWKNRARCWSGRTFQIDPEYDLFDVSRGVESVQVLVHPAHRVLLAALPAGDEIAVAFFVFDETFPQRNDLGAEIAAETGLQRIELRYGYRTVPLREEDNVTGHRKEPAVIADGLVHAILHAKPSHVLRKEAGARTRHRFRSIAALVAVLVAWFLARRLRPAMRRRTLTYAVFLTALLAGLRLLLVALGVPDAPHFAGTLFGAPGDVLLTSLVVLFGAILVARASRQPRQTGVAAALTSVVVMACFVTPRALQFALAAIATPPDDVVLFDSMHVAPGAGAAMLLVSVCFLIASIFLVCSAGARWGRLTAPRMDALPFLAIALAGLWWKGPVLAAGCVVAAIVLRRAATRPERAAAIAFLAAIVSAPLLYSAQRDVFTHDVADRTRALVGHTIRLPAETRLRHAVEAATDPALGVHTAVAEALARGEEPRYFAFRLWSATVWNPVDPCAVQVWDLHGNLISAFDFDSPPMRLLPPRPEIGHSGLALSTGQGAGEAIHYYTWTFPLVTVAEQRTVGIARFLIPDHWDVLLTNLRPSMFSEPLDVLGPSAPRPLVMAELAPDGEPVRTSDGTTADLVRPSPELLDAARTNGYASTHIRYRGQDARLVLAHAARYNFGALVFRDSLLQQGGLAFAKILLTNSALCLLYVLVQFLSRRQPVVFLFRHRVTLFLAAVSVAPVLLLAVYNKRVTTQRYEAEIADRLHGRLDLAETLLRKQKDAITSEWCTGFAADYHMDINVYKGQELVATSRPGVWDTGLLARRLAAGPYLALAVENRTDVTGHEFFTRGSGLRAAYRKVRREPESTDLILAAPALEDRRDLERRAAESNALLLAIYLTTALVAVFVALYLARSLTHPVRRLREATQRVAAGDLYATLDEDRADEFGDLVRAFNRMTREIRETQELRVRVEKAAAWREMARQIAHEIKNPLTPIKLTVQNLLADFEEESETLRGDFETGAHVILEQIDALQRIAGEFSAYARFPMRDPDMFDIRDLVEEVAKLFGAEPELADETLVVRGDRDELRRALINLATNSKQAGATKVRIRANRVEDLVVVGVHDDGQGISTIDMDRIWEPSFTTKSAGTGLGMPIVKRVIDDHGGSIQINSTPGQGTSVIIRLPFAAGELD